ncbi:MAG: NADH-quinone oxidoreductase subunit L [bacterium]
MNFAVENAWMIAALPLWTFLLILVGKGFRGYSDKRVSMGLTVGATSIGLILSSLILIWCISHPNAYFERNFTWLNIGDIKLSFGWVIDRLSAIMLMVVTSVSLMVQIYTHEYMGHDKGYNRFYAYLSLFNFSMLGLVLSTNLFQMYVFWELVGVSSYLLIGFWFARPSAASAAKKAFIMNRIGDFGFLAGILGLLYFSFSYWVSSPDILLSFSSLGAVAPLVFAKAGMPIFTLICFGLFMGTIAKSAQYPLHTWLPDAMEGPTPISALIHAATMVAAGVYLLARVFPFISLSPIVMNIILWVGAITAFMSALTALTQPDIKKALAYSTCSQLGFMVMAVGAGAYGAGMFHLVTHAYFKAMLFLCSGAVIHGLADQQDMRYMGGLRKVMPVVAYAYLIGTFAISGLFLSGFWSKEEIFSALVSSHNTFLLVIALLTAGMTSFYMFRTYFLTFEGEYRGHGHPHKPGLAISIPLIILAIPSIFLGFMLSGKLSFMGIGSFSQFLVPAKEIAEHSESLLIPVISVSLAIGGMLLAGLLYLDRFKSKFPVSVEQITDKIPVLYKLSYNKFYIDDAYKAFAYRIVMRKAQVLSMFDKYIVDGLINLTALFVGFVGRMLCLLQNGNVQIYLTILLTGFVVISAFIMLIWFV